MTNLQLMKAGKRPTMTGTMFNPFRKKKTQRAVVGIEALRCFAKG